MTTPPPFDLSGLAEALERGYGQDARAEYIGGRYNPGRDEIFEVFSRLRAVFFPGYGGMPCTRAHIGEDLRGQLHEIHEKLARQVGRCLCLRGEGAPDFDEAALVAEGARIATSFMEKLPALRGLLLRDAHAALDGDPAAHSLDEVILAYPGFLAICVHRVAHELFRLGVPLLPRILSEWAHSQTGADIHPGATIGESFFIDHATGVVIGETSHIGARVRLYQGVTLGAMSLPRDASGRVVRQAKRHPTVEDDVTIYANATVLGGTTVLGRRSVIGGSVFLTKSVPEGSRVSAEPPKLVIGGAAVGASGDFDI